MIVYRYIFDTSELEANYLPILSFVQTLNNPTKIILINAKIILYHAFLSNVYEYLKHRQHQYYHNQLKNKRHIRNI